MAAFFAGVNRYGVRSHESVEQFSLRPLLPPAEGQVHMEAVARYQKRKQALENSQREIEKAVREDLTNVEKEEFRHAMNRYPLIAKRVGKVITAEQAEEYRVNTEQLALLEREKPATLGRALCITEMGSQPGPMHVRIRGSANALGEEVVPGYPEVLTDQLPTIPPSPSDKTSGRRSVLADWITSKSNPLTARVMANRLWHYHFGRGLVRSPNDFGYQGTAPSHPELLDYLAGELIRADWQLKPVHRQLLLSKTYRLSSASQAKAYEKDPLNDLFWRYDPRRLTAEEIRDSMLAATGQLNLAKFGMWMYPTIEQEVLAGQSRPGSGWGRSSAADQSRRSIYVHIKRSLAVPLLAAFDSAEPDFSCPARFATTQPTQALGMLNSNFLQTCSKQLAEHAKRLGGDLRDAQVAAALRQVTQREPTKIEIDRGVKLIERLQSEQAHSADDALQRFCLIALNLNEFLYLD